MAGKVRGMMTVALGGAILAVAILSGQAPETNGQTQIALVGAQLAACEARGVDTIVGRIGCNPEERGHVASKGFSRMVGSARFVSARID